MLGEDYTRNESEEARICVPSSLVTFINVVIFYSTLVNLDPIDKFHYCSFPRACFLCLTCNATFQRVSLYVFSQLRCNLPEYDPKRSNYVVKKKVN
jgi:hypothetical protein